MLYIGNFKMDIPTESYIAELEKIDINGEDLWMALPYPYLTKFEKRLKNVGIEIGAQNVTSAVVKESTGEVSAEMLVDVGCLFTLVGHSERRKDKGETYGRIVEKCQQALAKGLKVVLCVGESREDYENGNTSRVLEKQLRDVLTTLKGITYDNFIIAYEPIWAIGTGLIPSIDEIEVVVRHLKSMAEKWAKSNLRVLYGGSLKASNAKLLKSADGVDGFLIGGACKKVDELQKIIKA